jgi:hypothetical protein
MTTDIIEMVTFALAEGVTEQDFMTANAQFETFLNAQTGLLYRSLAKQHNSKLYIDVIYWASLHDATRVQQAFYDSPECQRLIEYIDKDTVELTHSQVIAQIQGNN